MHLTASTASSRENGARSIASDRIPCGNRRKQLGNLRLNRRRRRVGASSAFSSRRAGSKVPRCAGSGRRASPARPVASRIAVWISALALTARITHPPPAFVFCAPLPIGLPIRREWDCAIQTSPQSRGARVQIGGQHRVPVRWREPPTEFQSVLPITSMYRPGPG